MNNLKLLLEKPIAHRGLHNEKFPENSLCSISNAFKNNYNCEIDVRATKDNQIIVFHDDSFLRMCGINKKVNQVYYSEIMNCTLQKTNEKIPLLKDIINLLTSENALLIEIKNDGINTNLEKLIKEVLNNCTKNIFLQSFNPFSVKWLKKHFNKFPIGLITSDFKNDKMNWFLKYLLTRESLANFVKPDFAAVDINSKNHNLLIHIKKMNLPILTWTVNSDEKLIKAKQFADNIIFEKIIP